MKTIEGVAGHVIRGGCLALGLAAAALAETPTIGQVDRIQNRVTAEVDTTIRTLGPAAALYFGDLLTSHAEARLEARLVDETRITLGENASLRIDEFVYVPGSPGGKLALRVLGGAFLLVGGAVESTRDAEVSITTTFATLGIRGTTVWGGPLDGGFAVLVLEGEVSVSNAGTTVVLTPNTGTTIADATSPPGAPVVWPQERVDRAIATISFAQ